MPTAVKATGSYKTGAVCGARHLKIQGMISTVTPVKAEGGDKHQMHPITRRRPHNLGIRVTATHTAPPPLKLKVHR
ncbi:hypothetical protein Nepgr_021964 [Nepenthes gracilis]|uniref:Uncharacterized protein n=1 Tax=Nepenthes gracilis TaxID=150966 RepID=A0AAD3SZD4_NEPGR|nr:hypothetical protein Nepgr_021964 [Nepenthes gracilis]